MPCRRVADEISSGPFQLDVEAAGHGRDHAAAAEMLGDPVGEIGGDQRQRDLDLRIPARRRARRLSQPTAVPNRISATTMTKKVPVAFGSENSPVVMAASAKR